MVRCQVTSEKSSKNYISLFGGKPARGLPTPAPTPPRAVTAHFTRVGRKVRAGCARFTRGNRSRGRGEREVIWETVPFVNGSWDQLQTQTKVSNTILLLLYLEKICLILTDGFWQASANLYSGGRLYVKGSRSQWPALSRLHCILQATPL